jgi:hypothetical protein
MASQPISAVALSLLMEAKTPSGYPPDARPQGLRLTRCNSTAKNETEFVNTIMWGMFIGSMVGITSGAVFGNLGIGIGFGPLFGALGGLIYSIVHTRQVNKY